MKDYLGIALLGTIYVFAVILSLVLSAPLVFAYYFIKHFGG